MTRARVWPDRSLLSVALTLPLALAAPAARAHEAAKPATPAASPSPAPLAEQDEPVALIGSQPITRRQLEEKAVARLLPLRIQLYDAERQALEELIAERLIAAEAQRRGVSAEDLTRQEVTEKLASVPAADVASVFEQIKSRVGDKTLADFDAQIRERLRRAEWIAGLKRDANVKLLMDPPRAALPPQAGPEKGGRDARVTVVEFSDFQCPYCARVLPTLKRIEERYGDRIRLVFRDYPLPIHPQAAKAAEAAACAADQGKFWEMHDRLFENQAKLQVADLKEHAAALGLAPAVFDDCLDSGRHEPDWQRAVDDGTRAGVSATPSFFINGRLISGALPYESFVRVLDEELQRAGVALPEPPPAAKPEPAPAQN